MKLYFAGPLFTTPERTWNAEVVAALRAAGHEIFLPQENEPGKDAAGIFAGGRGRHRLGRWAHRDHGRPGPGLGHVLGGRLRIRDEEADRAGADRFPRPRRSGRHLQPDDGRSATVRLDLPAASTIDVIGAILEGLERVERGQAAERAATT